MKSSQNNILWCILIFSTLLFSLKCWSHLLSWFDGLLTSWLTIGRNTCVMSSVCLGLFALFLSLMLKFLTLWGCYFKVISIPCTLRITTTNQPSAYLHRFKWLCQHNPKVQKLIQDNNFIAERQESEPEILFVFPQHHPPPIPHVNRILVLTVTCFLPHHQFPYYCVLGTLAPIIGWAKS